MSWIKSAFVSVGLFWFAAGAIGCESKKPCKDLSMTACDKAAHCSSRTISAPRDANIPLWECVPKGTD